MEAGSLLGTRGLMALPWLFDIYQVLRPNMASEAVPWRGWGWLCLPFFMCISVTNSCSYCERAAMPDLHLCSLQDPSLDSIKVTCSCFAPGLRLVGYDSCRFACGYEVS
jgi:hypothetical protein